MLANIDVNVRDSVNKLAIPAAINPFGENGPTVIVFRALRHAVKAVSDPNVDLDKYYGKTPAKAYLYSQKVNEKGQIEFDLLSNGEAYSINGVVRFNPKQKVNLPELPLIIVPDKIRQHFREEIPCSLTKNDILDNEELLSRKLKKSPKGQYLLACKDIMDELKEKEASIGKSFIEGTQVALVDISGDSPHVLCCGVVNVSCKKEISFKWKRWTQRMGKESKSKLHSARHQGNYDQGNYDGVVAVPITFLKIRLGLDHIPV